MTAAEATKLKNDVCLHFFHRLTEFEKANDARKFPDPGAYLRAMWAFMAEKDKDLSWPTKPHEWGKESQNGKSLEGKESS